MAQGETPITVVGNMVADPELRFTANGAAVASFRVASTPRRYNPQTNQWEDGDALFLSCSAWRQMADNVAKSLTKGMRVIVTGRLRQRNYEDREGNRRSVFEIDVDEVGPSLKYATADVARNQREGGGGNYGNQQYNGDRNQGQGYPANNGGGFGGGSYQGGFGGSQQGGFGGGSGSPQQSAQPPQNDPWSSAPQSGSTGLDDKPPF